MRKDGLPETLEELCDYIIQHADAIRVREKVDGKWRSYSLSELPATKALGHALRWIKNIQVPIRILSEKEIKERGQ